MTSLEDLRDACHLLGGLLLDGANVRLLEEVRGLREARRLAGASQKPLSERLEAMQEGLETDSAADLAAEYTRLFMANADNGARGKLPVPPWEDCYGGGDRRVHGERSLAAFKTYVEAGLGFEGMKGVPSDHIGLELCFVAALLDEEVRGARDDSARRAFVNGHLAAFAPVLGTTLVDSARRPFWSEVGKALTALPREVQPAAELRAGS
ncbi:MAG: TorD/DmsD family molecular chaperone [Myxococcaceae bacterium]